MDCKEIREMYKLMFAEYPDIVTVKDLQAMLGISRHAAYDLLGEGEISCIRLANAYKIPKINVINEHGDAGDVFERCAAESTADRGFGSLGHKESLT